ncbi:MAG: TIGR00366 family protein [Acetobacteraceae bacterium]
MGHLVQIRRVARRQHGDLHLLIAGIGLHGSPIAYAGATRNAARQTGSMMLQYPIYGGIMGIISATGLAEQISRTFIAAASSIRCRS